MLLDDCLGKKINKLLILQEVKSYCPACRANKRQVLTRCDCGKESVKILSYILSGHTKSCGCDRTGRPKKDLIGQKIGTYLIIEELERDMTSKSISNKHHSRLFLCECDKGRRHGLTMARLRSLKDNKSCLICK